MWFIAFKAGHIEQKPLLRHELSLEQMKYYMEITQAAVGRQEDIRIVTKCLFIL